MNEELKVIISAEISKVKKGVDEAKKEINSFTEQVKKASKDVDSKFKSIGESIGSAIKSGVKVATTAISAASTAIAGFVASSVKSFADYEQLVGGVDKLFGESSATVQKYAEDAYRNAGISANEYMTQITSFSASLISSLGGDTAAAAEYGNMAVNDMSDNVNVFGSNVQDVQNAYQGFAKQNYTMLDNLKLGYGGTKEEMERLIEDANRVKVANGEMADLSIDSFADVVEAIHIIQTEMNITGTTAKEAEGTITGSIAMTKSAWDNLMSGLAQSNADIPQLVNNVLSSATSVLNNIIPVVKEVLKNIPIAISEISPEAGAVFQVIVDTIMAVLPILKDALSTTFDIIVNTIKFISEHTTLFSVIAAAIGTVVAAIGLYNAVAAVKAAMDAAQAAAMMAALAPYALIVAAIGALVAAFLYLWNNCEGFRQFWIDLWEKVKTAFSQFVESLRPLIDAVVNAFKQAWELIKVIWDKVKPYFEMIWNNIKAIFSVVKDVLGGFFKMAWEAIKAVWDVVVSYFTMIWNNIKAVFSVVKAVLTGDFKGAWDGIKQIFSNFVSFFKTLWESVKSIFAAVGNFFTTVFSAAWNGIKSIFSNIVGFFSGIWNNILNIFKNIGTAIGNAVKGAVSNAVNKVLSTACKIINGFISAINFAIGIINAIPGVNISKIKELSVPAMAKGGVVDGATLAMIGEQGKEAVVPLENNLEWLDKLAGMLNERMGGGRQPIILQVDGKTFAQTSIDSINQLTKQTGSLGLVLV